MAERKISVVMCVGNLNITGIGTVIINYCSRMNRDQFHIRILAGAPVAEIYRKQCGKLGIEIAELPDRNVSRNAYYRELWTKLKEEKTDIFHVHGNSSAIAVELFLAWKAGIKVRIAHSHNTTCRSIRLHKLLYPIFIRLCTCGIACCTDAGKWMFHDHTYSVIPNAFETEKFRFDSQKREQVRKENGLTGKFVIGHIGRFNDQKNQVYLLKLFEKYAAYQEDAVLLLVGTGPFYEKIWALTERHRYRDRIILYGETNDPAGMYMAMDVFCFPSLYEGLPVALLEAQMTGLPCIVSDKVTKEVDFGDIIWENIEDEPEAWTEPLKTIMRSDDDRISYYKDHSEQIRKYSITDQVRTLENLYLKQLPR